MQLLLAFDSNLAAMARLRLAFVPKCGGQDEYLTNKATH